MKVTEVWFLDNCGRYFKEVYVETDYTGIDEGENEGAIEEPQPDPDYTQDEETGETTPGYEEVEPIPEWTQYVYKRITNTSWFKIKGGLSLIEGPNNFLTWADCYKDLHGTGLLQWNGLFRRTKQQACDWLKRSNPRVTSCEHEVQYERAVEFNAKRCKVTIEVWKTYGLERVPHGALM
jgi:hypothetical protein